MFLLRCGMAADGRKLKAEAREGSTVGSKRVLCSRGGLTQVLNRIGPLRKNLRMIPLAANDASQGTKKVLVSR